MSDATETVHTVADEHLTLSPLTETEGDIGGMKFMIVAVVLGLVSGIAAFAVRLPYLALEPGNTFETEDYVVVDGADAYTSPGEVSFVTVTQRRLSPVDWVVSKLQDSDDIFHQDELLGDRTFEEQREENAQLMLTSQNAAIAAALAELGFETAEPAGVVVIDVVEGGPLDGVLGRNDVITEVDGIPVATFDELFDELTGSAPDATIELVAGRPGAEPQTVSVERTPDTSAFLGIQRSPELADAGDGALIDGVVEGSAVGGLLDAGDRVVGLDGESIDSFEALVGALADHRSGDVVAIEAVRVADDGTEELISDTITLGVRALESAGIAQASTQLRDAELPFEVGFTTEDIGGPSAGLAFTLTVLDVLTEGDLTGGANIVVTGTIDRDGNVGPIGGVKQKAYAARDAGADLFIVPERNLDAARAAVEDLRIEPVATLDEALEIIAGFGGNAGSLPSNGEL